VEELPLTPPIVYDRILLVKITVKCKLSPTPEQTQALEETLQRCKEALNYISKVAWEKKCFNRVALHHLIYREVRERFGLTAQLAVSVRDKVAFSYKADRSQQHIFKKPFVPLDPPRSFRLILNGGDFASISTLRGRQKIPLILGDYQRDWLKDRAKNICESEVTKNGDYYLHLTLEVEEPPRKEAKEAIGVDLGIKNLATTSDGDFFIGEQAEKTRLRFESLRAELQAKDTHSAKRHLKKVSGRERRFKSSVNHLISRRIVDKAKETGRAIVLERLKGIRQTTKVRKSQNAQHHKWAFGELTRFIIYKAKLAGVPVFFADPRHTSQRCSHCGYISRANRKSQSEFACQSCGFTLNADHNAALNLSWAFVNTPNVLCLV
jgi:IS605 OrfB family transposase